MQTSPDRQALMPKELPYARRAARLRRAPALDFRMSRCAVTRLSLTYVRKTLAAGRACFSGNRRVKVCCVWRQSSTERRTLTGVDLGADVTVGRINLLNRFNDFLRIRHQIGCIFCGDYTGGAAGAQCPLRSS